jgi:demethylmenaquinone methyltransferase/2-methoxy-6-polyprenyl-1,4-benzoquinol methylase/phosphoethanolamine N-methyltransferase
MTTTDGKRKAGGMHQNHAHSEPQSGPQTRGATLHKASQYDFHTRLLGLGVNQANSKMIAQLANIKPGDNVLDVGCGSGNLTLTSKQYAGHAGSVNGIDASSEMIELARKKATQMGTDVVFDVALIEKLPFGDSTFDVVISRLVMHHLPDDLKLQAFVEILRTLKSGGLAFLTDFQAPANPVLAHLVSLFIGHPDMVQSNVSSLVPMLAQAGFVDVTSGRTRSLLMGFARGRKPQNQ